MICIRSENKNGNIIQLDEQINGEFQLQRFIFTNNLYNVNNYNNIIYINVGSTDYQIPVPNGFYTYDSIISVLQTALLNGTGTLFTITFDYNSRKFTFTAPSTFKFTFSTNTNNSIGDFLGFDEDTVNNTTQTSNKTVDFNSIKIIFAQIEEDENKTSLTNYLQSSFFIHAQGSNFGNVISYPQNVSDYTPILQFSNINRLKINFYDINNNKININDWILFLKPK